MSMTKQEFDRIHEAGRELKSILQRDRIQYEPGIEAYLVRAVEEATRLTKRAPDVGQARRMKAKIPLPPAGNASR